MINLQEIFIVNITGAILLLILPHLRLNSKEHMHYGDQLFSIMSWVSFGALIIEMLTFVINGQPGTVCRVLSYIFNGYLFLASAGIGMLWVFYIDYSIYHSVKRLRQRFVPLFLPFFLVAILILFDMFGAGNIFYITSENLYVRGPFVFLSYIVMFFYFFYSFILESYAIKQNIHILFPIHYFVLPCMAGTVIQGMFYGITIGWFCVSIAFLLTHIQCQNLNTYVDDLSGLYNRRYYNYYINKTAHSEKCRQLGGIMIDVNHFKEINDRFGHIMGDDAICNVSAILTEVTNERAAAFRLSGDEFAIIGINFTNQEISSIISDLHQQVDAFNAKNEKPYRISLAIGYTVYPTEEFDPDKFFHQMDTKMYEAKAAYYSQNGKDRRK